MKNAKEGQEEEVEKMNKDECNSCESPGMV